MLESIRTHQRALQFVLLLIIFPSFAFFGIQSYTGFFDKASDLVKVDGQAITTSELDFAVKSQAEKMGSDPSIASNPRFKQAVLNDLLQQRLVNFELKSARLQVPDQTLANRILQIPDIAALKLPDGSIDQVKYRQLLSNNRLTIEQFQDGKRREIMANDLQYAIGGSTLSASSKISQIISETLAIEREVRALFFLAKDYLNDVKPSNEDLENFYKTNSKLFETSSIANVEYVVLKGSDKEDAKDFSTKADKFANLVFEQSESLKPASDQLKLQILTGSVSPNGVASLPKNHLLNQPQVVKAIFSNEDVLKNGRNTEAIQISPTEYVALRVIKYSAPELRSFDSVKSEINKIVSLKQAESLAVKKGEEVLESLRKDPQVESKYKFGKSVWVSRNKPLDLKDEAYEKVFAVNLNQKLPSFTASKTPGIGFAVFMITDFRTPKSQDSKIQIEQFKQISTLGSQAEMGAYFSNIRDRANVKIVNLPK